MKLSIDPAYLPGMLNVRETYAMLAKILVERGVACEQKGPCDHSIHKFRLRLGRDEMLDHVDNTRSK